MLSKGDAAETGFQEPLKSPSEGKIYLSRFLRMPTLTSLIKRRIVKDRKSEQVSSQMQMWILLQEIVTWSAARHKRREEKREGERAFAFLLMQNYVSGWVGEGAGHWSRFACICICVCTFACICICTFACISRHPELCVGVCGGVIDPSDQDWIGSVRRWWWKRGEILCWAASTHDSATFDYWCSWVGGIAFWYWVE